MTSAFSCPRAARPTARTPIAAAALLAWAAALPLSVHAQTAPASPPPAEAPAAAGTAQASAGQEFPADAQVLSASELDTRLRGKAYTATLPNGMRWRGDYKSSGYVFVNIGNGSDTGQWRIEDGKVCVEYRGRLRSGCSEIRASGQMLYSKNSVNGMVTAMHPD